MGMTSLSVGEGNGSEGGSYDKLIGRSPPVFPENLTPSRTQEEVSFRSTTWPGRTSWFLGWGVSHQEIGKRPPRPRTCSHRPSPEGPSRPLLSGLATMKLHRKSVLSYFRGTGARAPDREGILLKKGTRNPSYQRRWFILRGNLLYYLEHQGDRTPLGLILLDSCRVEPRDSTTEPYAFVILASEEGGRSYKLAAEKKVDFDGWLQALVWAGWSQLWELLQPLQEQYQRVCQEAGVEPQAPPQEDRFLGLPCSPAPSGFQELHQRFGEEIQALARSRATRRQVDLMEFG
uniref:Sesquipedalian n=1 Tax=Phascolarctos cinereus TaxID=38626 RepID=A0A6P5M7M1_PHACI|nr:sesquipedalian-1-like [Phascolarctos cinereus]